MDERHDGGRPDPCPSPTGEELDEAAAASARERYRTSGLAPLTTDERLAALLRPGERVFALHEDVVAHRRPLGPSTTVPDGTQGTLLLTSARIIVSGPAIVEADLEDIEEAVISGDQLLLVLGRGVGLSLTLAQPRLLRVQVAAARSVTRGAGTPRQGQTARPAR